MRRWISAISLLMAGLALAACSGTEAISLNQAEQNVPSGQVAGATPADPQASAAAIAAARVHFSAAVGTPAEALKPLQDALNNRARARGLTIETPDKATLVVNGYFSTVAEERQTIVIYVWDVSDKAGNRLHRIQGQEKATGQGQGWDAVSAETVSTIGQRSIDELADWLARGKA